MAKTVVVATSNAHKVTEIMQIVDAEGYEFVALGTLGDFPSPVEDGETFVENARIKARAAHEETGLAAMADDSGLCVDALGGMPGIYSSRYAALDGSGEGDVDNNAKLLRALEGVPEAERTARFTCAIVFIDEDGSELSAVASVEGRIDDHLHGEGGFGYDPLFLPDEYGGELSMAELAPEQKNAISHRGKALRALKELL